MGYVWLHLESLVLSRRLLRVAGLVRRPAANYACVSAGALQFCAGNSPFCFNSCLQLSGSAVQQSRQLQAVSAEFKVFQRNYVLVFLIMFGNNRFVDCADRCTGADWLQGPYVYALYTYYGFTIGNHHRVLCAHFCEQRRLACCSSLVSAAAWCLEQWRAPWLTNSELLLV